ncbi:MAG TPA: galactitol-1-phosphate 5-dehydrogenase [Bryobacteraceae bacterium]|jgi:L-iditol 2-dehydrogenase
MRALLLEEYMKLRLVDMAEPQPGPDDVLVRVRACGICGSDVHGLDGSTGRRIPPLVMGHEAAGEVAAVGSQVHDLRPGDRVTFDSTIYCGECDYCRRGQVNLCDNREVLGVSPGPYRRHGAFAEYVTVPRRIVYKLPDNLPYEHAAMIEAVSVAVHAVSLSGPVDGLCCVIGAGMIGLLTIQALRAAGATRVAAIDPDDSRLELARRFGAEPVAKIENADLVIECVGAQASVRTAIDGVRKGGRVTLVGNIAPTVEIPLQAVVSRQLLLQGSCASSGEYPECIRLMSEGKILVEPLISAVAPLEDGANWFDRLYRRERGLMKVVLRP